MIRSGWSMPVWSGKLNQPKFMLRQPIFSTPPILIWGLCSSQADGSALELVTKSGSGKFGLSGLVVFLLQGKYYLRPPKKIRTYVKRNISN
jgi:hypothetical protein